MLLSGAAWASVSTLASVMPARFEKVRCFIMIPSIWPNVPGMDIEPDPHKMRHARQRPLPGITVMQVIIFTANEQGYFWNCIQPRRIL